MRVPPKDLSGGLFFGVNRGLIEQLGERVQLPLSSSRSTLYMAIMPWTNIPLTILLPIRGYI